MIDIVREASGKQYILFIIDEVGQYVGSRARPRSSTSTAWPRTSSSMGDGKVWIIGTAQQTLTEDDPRAAFNSPELFKLKDRFPIQVDLESSDIKEICYRRLLGKSPAGEQTLGRAVRCSSGRPCGTTPSCTTPSYYDADFNRETFINLYPFLPAHFDILLHLLGALAKSTGGIGLRSAIKVIQDILVEGSDGRTPVADQPVGLAGHHGDPVRRAGEGHPPRLSVDPSGGRQGPAFAFHDSALHQEVAKTVAVLQILGNMPVTVQNLASLMHPPSTAPSRLDEVRKARRGDAERSAGAARREGRQPAASSARS